MECFTLCGNALFVAEGEHGGDAGSAAGWHQAGEEADEGMSAAPDDRLSSRLSCSISRIKDRSAEEGGRFATWKRDAISRSAARAANLEPRRFQIGHGPSSESAGGSHRGSGWSAQCRRR